MLAEISSTESLLSKSAFKHNLDNLESERVTDLLIAYRDYTSSIMDLLESYKDREYLLSLNSKSDYLYKRYKRAIIEYDLDSSTRVRAISYLDLLRGLIQAKYRYEMFGLGTREY